VREFFLSNAEYWIREFHFDGLRFDAYGFLLLSLYFVVRRRV
jgi:1,4-alpha-glucan branching enzyme